MGFYSLFDTLNSFGLLIGNGTLNSPGLHFDYDTLSLIVLLTKGGALMLFGLLEEAGIPRRQQSAQSLPAPTTIYQIELRQFTSFQFEAAACRSCDNFAC